MTYMKGVMQQAMEDGEAGTGVDESDGTAAGLADSVIFESFVLLFYGTVCSLISFTLEFAVRRVMT